MGESKVAFVTGASRGIGRAIALDLARHGFDVAAAARSVDHSVVDWAGTVGETCATVREFGQGALAVKLDMTELDDVRRAVEDVMTEFGRIDVLVTSATNIDFSPDGTYLNEFVATSWPALERHIQVNITSSMLLLHLVLPIMYAQCSGIVMSLTQAAQWLEFGRVRFVVPRKRPARRVEARKLLQLCASTAVQREAQDAAVHGARVHHLARSVHRQALRSQESP